MDRICMDPGGKSGGRFDLAANIQYMDGDAEVPAPPGKGKHMTKADNCDTLDPEQPDPTP